MGCPRQVDYPRQSISGRLPEENHHIKDVSLAFLSGSCGSCSPGAVDVALIHADGVPCAAWRGPNESNEKIAQPKRRQHNTDRITEEGIVKVLHLPPLPIVDSQ